MGKYTNEKNAQVVLALLKAHGVRRIVVSPGSTNIPVSGSIQNDSYFEVYSSIDERSAAYMACGLAEKTGEPVALSCTGATASRNYLPGMTEAYYRKLPVIAITSFTGNDKVGHLLPQIIDRNVLPNDAAKLSVQLPSIKDAQDEWQCNTLVNTALNAAFRDGGGPVHINLPSSYTGVFDADTLPTQRVVEDLNRMHDWPDICGRKVALFIGSHKNFTVREVEAIEEFCASRDAIVACDHTSSYRGKYRVQPALIASNFRAQTPRWKSLLPDLVIHIGEVSGDYYGSRLLQEAPEVWRVSSDGALRDTGKKLRFMFQGDLVQFLNRFEHGGTENRFFDEWQASDEALRRLIPELPFSNIWLASQIAPELSAETNVYLGILNSLRSWNFFPVPPGVSTSSNVGGFGIDGCLSTTLGGALASPNRLNIAVLGDLAFFYDMNTLGNRHMSSNIRIALINNGCGVEFNNSNHIASHYKSGANRFIAAGGHFNSGAGGSEHILPVAERMNTSLAKAWCEANGFEYAAATSKDEFLALRDKLLSTKYTRPILVESFTSVPDESRALEMITSVDPTSYDRAVLAAKKVLSPKLKAQARTVLKKITK